MATAKLRKFDTSKVLTPAELELLNWNFWAIEAALNSVGAATPGNVAITGVTSHHALTDLLTYDDHLQYVLLAGRIPGQSILGSSEVSWGITPALTLTAFNNPPIAGTTGEIDRSSQIVMNKGITVYSDYFNVYERSTSWGSGKGFEIFTGDGFCNVVNIGSITVLTTISAGSQGLIVKGLSNPNYPGQRWVGVDTGPSGGGYRNLIDMGQVNIGMSGAVAFAAWPCLVPNSNAALVLAGNNGVGGELLTIRAVGAVFGAGTARISCENLILSGQAGAITLAGGGYQQQQGTLLTLDFATVNITGALTVSGALPVHNLLDSSVHSDTVTRNPPVRGDLIVANSTPKWTALPKGTADYFLKMGTDDPAWFNLFGSVNIWTAEQKFHSSVSVEMDAGGSFGIIGSISTGFLFFNFQDTDAGWVGTLNVPTLTADRTWDLPNVSGTLLTSAGQLGLNSSALVSNISSGFALRDSASTGKVLRFILSGLPASTNNSLTFIGTAAHDWKFEDASGSCCIIGNITGAVGAGQMKSLTLTGQGAAIGSSNMTNSTPAGMYEVSYYLECTIADGTETDVVKFVINYTDTVGATSQTSAGLSMTATTTGGTAIQGTFMLKLASGNITYSTTVTGGDSALATAKYALTARVKYLGP